MSLQDEVDEAAVEVAMHLEIIVARLDWDWLGDQWSDSAENFGARWFLHPKSVG